MTCDPTPPSKTRVTPCVQVTKLMTEYESRFEEALWDGSKGYFSRSNGAFGDFKSMLKVQGLPPVRRPYLQDWSQSQEALLSA